MHLFQFQLSQYLENWVILFENLHFSAVLARQVVIMQSQPLSFFQKIWNQRFFILLVGCWTLLLAFSIFWNLHENEKDTIGKARVEARTILQHNLAYRRWNSMHSGVYAKVSPSNPPNPYIVVKNRDVTTTNGMKLTLINPFQMTKQAYALLKKHSPYLAVINKTVSLNPLNPDNYPDEWERKGLLAFEEGKSEVNELTEKTLVFFWRICCSNSKDYSPRFTRT